MGSYYEQICRDRGIKIPLWVQYIRDANGVGSKTPRKPRKAKI